MPDTSTTDRVVSLGDERFVSVMATSNELEFKSLKNFADHVLDYLGKGKSGFEIKKRESSPLDEEAAVRLRVEYDGPDGRVIEEKLLSLRLGVLYEIGLRTTTEHYGSDEQNFSKVVAGLGSGGAISASEPTTIHNYSLFVALLLGEFNLHTRFSQTRHKSRLTGFAVTWVLVAIWTVSRLLRS